MAQVSIIIPDNVLENIQMICTETGRSQSSLCADWIKDGVYSEIEKLNKVEVYKQMIRKRRAAEMEQPSSDK